MNGIAMWAQRESIASLIRESPTTAIIRRKKSIPNGLGGTTLDPYCEAVDIKVTFRVAHERRQPPEIGAVNGAFFTSDHHRIATWEWNTDIREGDAYMDVDIGKRFVFGLVDALRKFGGIVGYQAPLMEAAGEGME